MSWLPSPTKQSSELEQGPPSDLSTHWSLRKTTSIFLLTFLPLYIPKLFLGSNEETAF